MKNNSAERYKRIKEHFEKEAAVFDKLFFKIMPRYEEMMQAVIDALPFHKKDKIRIIDLGCGTGNLAWKLAAAYPRAHITCIDMAENMLAMAKLKLRANRNVTFWRGDIRDFDYSAKYDVIVSSLVLHHLDKKEKGGFYRKLYNALSKKGVFYGIDIFLSCNSHLQKMYMAQWVTFMQISGLPMKKVNEMIARHQREDWPVVFDDELSIMRKAGFRRVDVILKHYNFAVYGGQK